MGEQAFIVYKLVAKLFGATRFAVPMLDFGHDLKAMREAVTDHTRLLFVASPNNPTGIANTDWPSRTDRVVARACDSLFG